MSSLPRRVISLLCLLVTPTALAAQSITPEEAIERQRAEIREVVSQVCPTGADLDDPNDVVVCGRREAISRYRVPPSEPLPGSRKIETAGGEQLRAMDAGSESCSTVGWAQGCGFINFLGIGLTVARAVIKGIEEHRD